MNLADVPQWAWMILAACAVLFFDRKGAFDNLFQKPAVAAGDDGVARTSLLERLQGYRTKLAALAIGVLSANEVWKFFPPQYVNAALYLSSAAGLYFLRDAVERVKQRVDQMPESPQEAPSVPFPQK